MNQTPTGLREKTRRAIQLQIAEAAQQLFIERGYEGTTIDDIADVVGMSRRSFHRYFPNKEDIVVGKLDFVADDMLEALRARPAAEPLWTSLRRLFDFLVGYVDAPGRPEIADPMQRIVFATPELLASYLGKLDRMQDAVEVAVRKRAETAKAPYAEDDPAPRAIVAAAFGCLIAAQRAWLAADGKTTFAETIDRAMMAVIPAGTGRTRTKGPGK